MRALIACGIILFLAGCVDYQLSGNEKVACASFTDVTVTGIPFCEKNTSCQDAFEKNMGTPTFHWLPIGSDWEKTKNQVISAWIGLNETHEWLKKTNEYCKKGNILQVWASGIDSAGAIQKGLKAAEQTNSITLSSLAKSMKTAETWELFYVKDTDAFYAYAELLEIIQGITTNDASNDTASLFSENQSYFEGLTEKITSNQASGMNVEWKSAFDVYKTSVTLGMGTNAKTILAFSPIWQGLISSFSNQNKAIQSLSVLQYLNAPIIVENISQIVRPQNGFVGKTMNALEKLEEGMKALEHEEAENNEHIESEMIAIDIQIDEIENENEEWSAIKKDVELWAKLTGVEFSASQSVVHESKTELVKNKNEWNAITEGKENNTLSIGKRVASLRGIMKAIASLQQKVDEEKIKKELREETCGKIMIIINEKNEGNPIDWDPVTTTCGEMISGLENAPFTLAEEYEMAKIEACVSSLNAWNSGMGVSEEYSVEMFVHEFGSASQSACESALMHAEEEYNNQFTIQAMNENTIKLVEWIQAVNSLPEGTEKEIWLSEVGELIPLIVGVIENGKQPIPVSEQDELAEQLVGFVDQMQEALGKAWIKSIETSNWKFTTATNIHSNEPVSGTWVMKWINPLNVEWDYSFTLSNESMIEWESLTSTSGDVYSVDKEVFLTHDRVPAEGIQVNGKGEAVLVVENQSIQEIEVVGNNAHVWNTVSFQTAYDPINVIWTWTPPAGVQSPSVSGEFENKPVTLEWNGGSAVTLLSLNQSLTTMDLKYVWEGAIASKTTLVDTQEEIGKTVYFYQTEVWNHTPNTLTIGIDTGVSADPFETSSVLLVNENGAVVDYVTNSLFGIFIEKITMQGNEKKLFYLTIVRPSGIDALKALIQTLLSEIKPLLIHSNTIIAAKANALYQKIETVLETNDATKLASALPGLSNEVQALILEAQLVDDILSEANAKWDDLKEAVYSNSNWEKDDEIKKWIQNGNAAQEKGQTSLIQQMSQNVEDWITQQKTVVTEMDEEKEIDDLFSQTVKETIDLAKKVSHDIVAYEKHQSLTCTKLMEVGYVCPISEEHQNKIKSYARDQTKNSEKINQLVTKGKMTNEEKISNEKIIVEGLSELQKYESQIMNANSVLEKMAEKTVNELIEKTKNENENELSDAREKAKKALENKEFGKAIYVAQNVLTYLKGKNPLTGLSAIPPEGLPLLGVIVAGVSWYGYRKWKEKNKPVIVSQAVPRSETITRPNEQRDSDE